MDYLNLFLQALGKVVPTPPQASLVPVAREHWKPLTPTPGEGLERGTDLSFRMRTVSSVEFFLRDCMRESKQDDR